MPAGPNVEVSVRLRAAHRRDIANSVFGVNEDDPTADVGYGVVACRAFTSEHQPKYPFDFDRVFFPACPTLDVFRHSVRHITREVLGGVSGVLVAAGQTCGAPFADVIGTPASPLTGLLPLAAAEFLRHHPTGAYDISITCVALQNEIVTDVLAALELDGCIPATRPPGPHAPGSATARAAASTGQFVRADVASMDDVVMIASKMRDPKFARANHVLFTFHLDPAVGRGATRPRRGPQFHIASLAPLEHGKQGLAHHALHSVLCAIAQGTPCVPYRESKLTYLIRSALTPTAPVAFLLHAATTPEDYYATLAMLKYAARLRSSAYPLTSGNVQAGVLAPHPLRPLRATFAGGLLAPNGDDDAFYAALERDHRERWVERGSVYGKQQANLSQISHTKPQDTSYTRHSTRPGQEHDRDDSMRASKVSVVSIVGQPGPAYTATPQGAAVGTAALPAAPMPGGGIDADLMRRVREAEAGADDVYGEGIVQTHRSGFAQDDGGGGSMALGEGGMPLRSRTASPGGAGTADGAAARTAVHSAAHDAASRAAGPPHPVTHGVGGGMPGVDGDTPRTRSPPTMLRNPRSGGGGSGSWTPPAPPSPSQDYHGRDAMGQGQPQGGNGMHMNVNIGDGARFDGYVRAAQQQQHQQQQHQQQAGDDAVVGRSTPGRPPAARRGSIALNDSSIVSRSSRGDVPPGSDEPTQRQRWGSSLVPKSRSEPEGDRSGSGGDDWTALYHSMHEVRQSLACLTGGVDVGPSIMPYRDPSKDGALLVAPPAQQQPPAPRALQEVPLHGGGAAPDGSRGVHPHDHGRSTPVRPAAETAATAAGGAGTPGLSKLGQALTNLTNELLQSFPEDRGAAGADDSRQVGRGDPCPAQTSPTRGLFDDGDLSASATVVRQAGTTTLVVDRRQHVDGDSSATRSFDSDLDRRLRVQQRQTAALLSGASSREVSRIHDAAPTAAGAAGRTVREYRDTVYVDTQGFATVPRQTAVGDADAELLQEPHSGTSASTDATPERNPFYDMLDRCRADEADFLRRELSRVNGLLRQRQQEQPAPVQGKQPPARPAAAVGASAAAAPSSRHGSVERMGPILREYAGGAPFLPTHQGSAAGSVHDTPHGGVTPPPQQASAAGSAPETPQTTSASRSSHACVSSQTSDVRGSSSAAATLEAIERAATRAAALEKADTAARQIAALTAAHGTTEQRIAALQDEAVAGDANTD